ncbi:DUF6338 family protein [Pectobacterium punjabense]|uniref:DUF6338 family protein n=1 Tax=Pectobacterium punjabense TaxID=2108399 RepID=UPI0024070137|nr:DUF6338 family protein [Pectobacterium punjabense]MDG0795662.1 DUF6338 family protein [Pectobacterium punjabense]
MESISSEIFNILKYLLPGFVTAWIFHALTAHPKPNQFERIVQALIFTLFVQCATSVTKFFLVKIGKLWSIGKWDDTAQLFWSVSFAIFIGFILVYLTNSNRFHNFLNNRNITKQSAYHSEWSDIFNNVTWFVILNLKNGRRVYGWPFIWPSDPSKGHVVLQNPEWIEGTQYIKLQNAEYLVINTTDIEYVEFLKEIPEVEDGEQ